jgi:hypothetical protein
VDGLRSVFSLDLVSASVARICGMQWQKKRKHGRALAACDDEGSAACSDEEGRATKENMKACGFGRIEEMVAAIK